MDKVSKLAQAVQSGLATSSSKSQSKTLGRTALPKNWVSALFLKFHRRYPHKWSSAIDGDEEGTIDEWADKLGGLTGDQLKHGLDSWDSDWPPSADEFKKCCLNKGKNGFGLDYTPEYHRETITTSSRLLSSDERDAKREANRSYIDKMKEALGR